LSDWVKALGYGSTTVEELPTPGTAQIHARLLLARIEEDEFPSFDIIDRGAQPGVAR
jgi:hypothetical protein